MITGVECTVCEISHRIIVSHFGGGEVEVRNSFRAPDGVGVTQEFVDWGLDNAEELVGDMIGEGLVR